MVSRAAVSEVFYPTKNHAPQNRSDHHAEMHKKRSPRACISRKSGRKQPQKNGGKQSDQSAREPRTASCGLATHCACAYRRKIRANPSKVQISAWILLRICQRRYHQGQSQTDGEKHSKAEKARANRDIFCLALMRDATPLFLYQSIHK